MSLLGDDQTILRVLPELLPLIASHLPLQFVPVTLAALARTSSSIYFHVYPILNSRIVIQSEGHAYQILERISRDPTLGPLIQELHIRIDLSVELGTQLEVQGDNTASPPIPVLVKLQQIIEKGSLFFMDYFRLVLFKIPYPKNSRELSVNARYRIPTGFWATLRGSCPNLRGLCMDGVGDSPEDPRLVEEPDFYDLEEFVGLASLSLKFASSFPVGDSLKTIIRSLGILASSLQSLTLFFNEPYFKDANLIFSITFPHLKSISFSGFDADKTTEKTMDFWSRHPLLERIVIYSTHNQRWFSNKVKVEGRFLPNLKHLRARLRDVAPLSKIIYLGQLEHLSISASYNWQVPYLLRSAIPGGLPNLKSLEIHQQPNDKPSMLTLEGARWYETEEGHFLEEKDVKAAAKEIDGAYMRSVVRATPNLKELYIDSFPPSRDTIKQSFWVIGQLRFLERFFYPSYDPKSTVSLGKIEPISDDDFKDDCRLLGNACYSLKTVTDVNFVKNGPYRRGTIERDFWGSVEGVVLGRGFGMESTGGVDDPFPLNKYFSYYSDPY